MRFLRVTAESFGALRDDAIDLAPGLTVVVGPNESGKSTWHAATYAGLCGLRRGKGRRLKDDELFAQRHQPWHGDGWSAASVIELADGRTVELRHDLADGVHSSARDLQLGTDLTHELIVEGAPDGSRFLGLDRRAFAALACVRQAEILAVVSQADSLQRHLQRAAATAGTDETAVAAIDAIQAYLREHVGTERANSTKPLMNALRAYEAADARHREAVAAHQEWLRREGDLAGLELRAREAVERADAAMAVLAEQRAAALRRRLDEVSDLAERHPVEPAGLVAGDDVVTRVTTAVHGWEQRPRPHLPVGPSTAQLRAQLDQLPTEPQGDLEPHPSVVAARRRLLAATSDLEAHRRHEPVPAPTGVDLQVTESELVDLARALEVGVADVGPELAQEVERLRGDEVAAGRLARRRTVSLVASLVLGILGFAVAGTARLAGLPAAIVAAAAAVGALCLAASAVQVSRPRPEGAVARDALRSAEARLSLAEHAANQSRQSHQAAIRRATELGLEPDASIIRELADAQRRAEHHDIVRARWEATLHELLVTRDDAIDALVAALRGRGVPNADVAGAADLLAAADAYELACRQRRDQKAEAQRRPHIEDQLAAREAAEQRFVDDKSRLDDARLALVEAAAAVGVVEEGEQTDHDTICARLRAWQADHDERRRSAEEAWREWSRLQTLLDGRTLDELAAEAEREAAIAAKLAATVPPDALGAVALGDDPEGTVRELSSRANERELELGEVRRELAVRAEALDPVAEAAEALAAAGAELERIRRVQHTLDTTERFMRAAQERVHRDIAPVLANRVSALLPQVTGGRYREVIVDPETLAVQVRVPSGGWRPAQHLSHGTAEQVYLLLRVAMAQILAGESCPMLLDDVTVHSDTTRTEAILRTLQQVSADHQVILFSQEDEVRRWAEANLGDRDRLILLPAA